MRRIIDYPQFCNKAPGRRFALCEKKSRAQVTLSHSAPRLIVVALTALAALATVAPGAASASSVSFSGDVLTYNAAAGEENLLELRRGTESYECGSRPAPCFAVDERNFFVEITSFPAGRCSQEPGTTVECDVPASVVVNLGDRDDNVGDWDGPSRIDGGTGNDGVTGRGGDDTITGGSGNDSLGGDAGNDTLNGGDGDDSLEGFWGLATFGDTAGSDVYVGGSGTDFVDYAGRSEGLSISLDGARNDGAPGEADNVGADVERLRGGEANDVLTGSPARNALDGAYGNDTLRGGPGEDDLLAGDGDDRLSGDAGQDLLQGANGDDELEGGPGEDSFNGDGDWFCEACGTGADRILARDGLDENVRCGRGEDSAILDPLDRTDQECEQVDRRGSLGGTTPGTGLSPGAATPPLTRDPYAKCRRLKGKKKKACVRKVKGLKRCSRLKGKKKKVCVRKVTRRLSGTGRR